MPGRADRGQWSREVEFFLSLVGYCIGIGVLVRFPYVCFSNGGGAFLIPFLLAYVFCGIPLFILEIILGQFSGLSAIKVWNFCPIFKGTAISAAIGAGAVGVYQGILNSYCLVFLVESFAFVLPWDNCENWWNSEYCWDGEGSRNITSNTTYVWASEEFFARRVLDLSASLFDIGIIQWKVAVASLVYWTVAFLCMAWGVKWTGKVVYLTALGPYLLIAALVVRGCTLLGSLEGLSYYLIPDFSKLLDIETWVTGFLQMFFSLGAAWGGVVTFASYCPFGQKAYREAIFVPAADFFTSFLAGLAIFSVTGFMAYETHLEVESVASSGPGLAFVVYPLALAKLPGAPLWSIVFFTTMIFLGLDSTFGHMEIPIAGIVDVWPKYRRHHSVVVGLVCLGSFLINLLLSTQGGMYYYQLIDWYVAIFTIPLVAVLEMIAVVFIYGLDNLSDDMKLMWGKPAPRFLKVMWYISIPLLLLMFVGSILGLKPPSYGQYQYPYYVHYVCLFGISIAMSIPIPIGAAHAICSIESDVPLLSFEGIKLRIREASSPNKQWGPQDAAARNERDLRLSVIKNRGKDESSFAKEKKEDQLSEY